LDGAVVEASWAGNLAIVKAAIKSKAIKIWGRYALTKWAAVFRGVIFSYLLVGGWRGGEDTIIQT
jgi:hypothetical protein